MIWQGKIREEKQKNRLKIALWLISLLGVILAAGMARKMISLNLPHSLGNLRDLKLSFWEKEIVSPLASPTAQDYLAKLLEEKQITLKIPLKTKKGMIEASLKNGPLVIFTSQKDLESQVTSLQIILERFKIEGRKVRKIDFRFDKPVISY